MGIASLVLGIISIVVDLATGGLGFIGVILGIEGSILGALARKRAENHSVATAGLVLSIIGVVLGLIVYVACIACVAGVASLV